MSVLITQLEQTKTQVYGVGLLKMKENQLEDIIEKLA
jgi:hypothetical protein